MLVKYGQGRVRVEFPRGLTRVVSAMSDGSQKRFLFQVSISRDILSCVKKRDNCNTSVTPILIFHSTSRVRKKRVMGLQKFNCVRKLIKSAAFRIPANKIHNAKKIT